MAQERKHEQPMTRMELRLEELAAKGSVKKGTGTMPDDLINEAPPGLPRRDGALAQLLEDRERGW